MTSFASVPSAADARALSGLRVPSRTLLREPVLEWLQ